MNKNNLTFTPDASKQFVNFPVWNLASVEIEPPSRYFALMPVGTGTGEVESLCSYISRLAEAHCVSPTRILFYSAAGQTASLPFSLQEKSLPAMVARTINGVGKTAETIWQLISKTTSINSIEQHTFLPWKHLISRHKLLNDFPSWCPACYNEQFQKQGFMYDKLAWSVNCVTVCPIHQIHLASICPYCAKKQKHLGNTSRVGFCDHCKKWLARTEDYGKDTIIGGNASQSLWIAGAVEELLSCSAKINSTVHHQENFIANLRLCINQTSFGSINDFAHTTGTWHVTIRRLIKGSSMPTMEMLMRICFALNLPPEKLFLNLNSDIPVGNACLPEVRDGLKNYSHLCESPEDIEKSKKQIIEYLENLLNEDPPISGRQAAQKLGWRDSKLYRSFPNLYRRIVLRHKKFSESNVSLTDDEVKEILQAAAKEDPPPSLQSVLRRFGCKNTGYRYQQKFPRHCKCITGRFNSYRNRLLTDESELNKFMEAVMTDYPPPSASQVAERLGITRARLHFKFPNQYKAVVNHFAEYILEDRRKVFIQLETEVEKAVREIIEENMYPSEERVKARLTCGYNDGNFKKVLSKVKNKIAIPFKPRY